MIEASTATAWYVYGVAETDPGLERLGDVQLVPHGRLAALVREVPLDEFGAEALPENLNDPEWLERNARAHEDVLQAVAALTTVVPLRFGTIYLDLEQVERMLAECDDELSATVARVRGHVELGVKAWMDRERFDRALAADEEPVAGGAGAAYLQQRRREQEHAQELSTRCAEVADEAHRRLSGVAVAAVANRPQPRELTGRSEDMLLNGAYLVPAKDERLREEVAQLATEQAALGVEYELTGPWPPHNFAGDRA